MTGYVKRTIFKSLYVQVLIAIAAGIALGFFAPQTGAAMKPLGDGTIVEEGLATAVECLHYALNLDTSVVITGFPKRCRSA